MAAFPIPPDLAAAAQTAAHAACTWSSADPLQRIGSLMGAIHRRLGYLAPDTGSLLSVGSSRAAGQTVLPGPVPAMISWASCAATPSGSSALPWTRPG
jgi:hypothetical protein